ncbi:MAG: M20/M25/M40 family metallo-hydrolase [Chloroflexota bacterium]|nr:M20/M25/M40 family metallo-hydrolase [Chloroflexota bacterium]
MTAIDPRDIDLVRGLVAIPSPSRWEGEAVEWLVDRMAERGFRASVDDAGNAVGEIGDGPCHVVLLGHIDTVPGEIPLRMEEGELVGRGAVDAKGPLAAFVAAATDVVAAVRVTVVGAVEEESPTSAGARFRATLPAPDWCVIGEPSGWDGITVGYKGRLVLRLRLERPVRHGASPGPTCAEEALELWQGIHAGAARWDGAARAEDTSRGPDASRAVHAARAPDAARGPDRLDCRLEGVVAEGGGDGDGDALVERAELRVGYRVPPGIETSALERDVRRIAGAHSGEARIAVERIAAEEPARTARTSSLARAFARAIVDAGGRPVFKEKSGTSDMNVLAPAWRCPMIAYGPGDARYDHTPIERLALADYARSIAVLKGVLHRAAEPA